ncbi:hypothetical protein [Youxingia wuxianensis]|uniref:Uncharacterized protein n=1 Tax=Youxingia wuxianensis TaxID=2763678 RepID=A0A926II76_9FIRM|nr:hypothetical protein [Youxingia wuxianensis]MBC8586066.1 hypothetical protein [Youxingia wuxianensis]
MELIDKAMLIKKLYSEKVKEVIGLVGIAWAESLLNTLPTVDAVSVVRCKDCARRNPSADLTDTVLCTWLHNLTMPKDGFCSYGERRVDNRKID